MRLLNLLVWHLMLVLGVFILLPAITCECNGQQPPVQPVPVQDSAVMGGPLFDRLAERIDQRLEMRTEAASKERTTLRKQLADLVRSREEIRREQAAMKGLISDWQAERTERKRIQVEIEKHQAAAEIARQKAESAAAEARKASANNRVWRFGMIAAICLTLLLVIFKK